MNPVDFFNNIVAHRELHAAGGDEARNEVFVRHGPSGVARALPVSEVLAHTWEDLEAVLTGRRDATIMIHMARIVGYYSQVRNWNRSKLAELRDRHRGDYALAERADVRREDVAPEVAQALAAGGGEMSCDVNGAHHGDTESTENVNG